MSRPEGLYYVNNVITNTQSTKVIEELDRLEWKPLTIKVDTGRLVQQYGYSFNYHKYGVHEVAPPMPAFIVELMDRLTEECKKLGLFKADYLPFNQCIINNYHPGQGISPHTDYYEFGPLIGCFTLGTGAYMDFTKDKDKFSLYTEPSSLYIMSGEARDSWMHSMASRQYDEVIDQNGSAQRINRGRRVSVTFRQVKPKD